MKEYTIDELVTVAKRENNLKRPYLYVNPIQGKHIPVTPHKALALFKCMGNILQEKYPYEQILVIGFAETATAVGAGISRFANNVRWCMQTTREKYEDAEYLYFTESHSHATEQSLIVNQLEIVLKLADRVVFAEDEVTTGNTIFKLICSIRKNYPDIKVRYTILSILNSMSNYRINELQAEKIDCLYVNKIPFEYKINSIDQYSYLENDNEIYQKKTIIEPHSVCSMNLRYVHECQDYHNAVDKYVECILSKCDLSIYNKILVLGTEEFMFPPLMVANKIEESFPEKEIWFHATTRSPILVSEADSYPLTKRNKLISFYDENRVTYVYNLQDYDLAIVLSDSKYVSQKAVEVLLGALNRAGCDEVIFGKG